MEDSPVSIRQGIYMVKVPLLIGSLQRDRDFQTLSYLIDTGSGWLMVDSGYNDAGAFDILCRRVSEIGLSIKDIRWLFLTHYHPDHSGLAKHIKDASGAQVIIHRADWDILQHTVGPNKVWNLDGLVEWAKCLGVPPGVLQNFYDMASFGRALFPTGLEPDVVLDNNESQVIHDQFRAILTPGHSPGHICLHDRERRILFSGDHVLVDITPHISPSHLTSYNQLGQYLEALRKVQPLDVDQVLPAHERPFDGLAKRVDEILVHHEQRLAEVIDGLSDRTAATPWDLAEKVSWDVGTWAEMDATNRVLAVRETLAHLEYLESNGQVGRTQSGPVNIYRLVAI